MQHCVDVDTILDFVAGRLSADALASMEQHADGCATCFDLIATAAGALATEPAPLPLPVPHLHPGVARTVAGYRLVEALGYGGAGIVYRAVHQASGAEVALKTVRLSAPGALSSIRREIQALGRVRHPGVVRILDHGVEEGRPWYAMELIEGPTLHACLCTVASRG